MKDQTVATHTEVVPRKPQDGPVSHRTRAIEATVFVLVGYGISQLLRLAGNLVLTRLLAPELFGFMALAQAFLTGVHMVTDVGLAPAIVRSKRANDPSFLNTAWTLQIIRGFAVFVVSVAIAAPVASLYNEPMLLPLVPAIALTQLPRAFGSTSLALLSKELRQKELTYMELAIQAASLVCMVVVAYVYRSVWALVIGGVVSSTIRLVWSHRINRGAANRFRLDRQAVSELLTFGKWVFVASAVAFLATQTDRLLLGRLFPMGLLGVYGIAIMLAGMPQQVIVTLSSKVIFPLVAKLKELPRSEIRNRMRKPRAILLVGAAVLVAVFSTLGDFVVLGLYDDRYSAAAWMFPILAVGIWPMVLVSSIDRTLYAIGKPIYNALGNLAKFVYLAIALPASYAALGALGPVIAVALDDIPVHLLTSIGLWREKLSLLRQDAWSTCLLLVLVAMLLGLRGVFGLGMPWAAAMQIP